MPRRGGGERWRSGKQVRQKPERFSLPVSHARVLDALGAVLAVHQSPITDRSHPSGPVFHCNHGVPWQSCARCSKQVRK